ncbi:hypothetical protein MFIFM68171_07033 [Madurella fahalii]|uniref:Thioester reductase (TE) domain-containing protein n=1 Tax=Madurella fahalii TaxID=1157608 RepID=A0ABQ0GGF6_9PEZI
MLDLASSCPSVKKIICLNRSGNARDRQTKGNGERGLSIDFSNAEFLHADLSRFDLGLGKEAYGRLLSEVDRVIHNQWPFNFNMPVESFEPHIRGLHNLAEFSCKAAKRVPVVFISSIATVEGWKGPDPVPEQSLHNFDISMGGYGRSKLVGSLVLEKASDISGVPTEIIRVGQIAGPSTEKGYWNRQEWLPSIIASSVYLARAGVTCKVAVEDINGYFHGINPEKTQWETLAKAVKEFYGDRIKRVVDLDEWVSALERSQTTTEDINKNPSVKLLETYKAWARAAKEGRGYVAMDTGRTMNRSKTMREMQAITPELMKNWCRQWRF